MDYFILIVVLVAFLSFMAGMGFGEYRACKAAGKYITWYENRLKELMERTRFVGIAGENLSANSAVVLRNDGKVYKAGQGGEKS